MLAGSSLTACLNQTVSSKKSIANSCAKKKKKVIPFSKQQCSSSVKTMKFVLLASRATKNIVSVLQNVLKKNYFVMVQLFSLYWRECGSSWDSKLSIKLHTVLLQEFMNNSRVSTVRMAQGQRESVSDRLTELSLQVWHCQCF